MKNNFDLETTIMKWVISVPLAVFVFGSLADNVINPVHNGILDVYHKVKGYWHEVGEGYEYYPK